MSRPWIPKTCFIAVACLAAIPLAADAQQPPAAAPADVVLPAPVPSAEQGQYFVLEAPAPQPAVPLARIAAAPDEAEFFLAQAAAPAAAARLRIVQAQDEATAVAGGEFWIGVQLEPLPELVKSQLQLERGMVVVHVFDDSPAAKAEFKVNDIILRAGDQDIKEPQDLIHAVNEAKDKELAIRVLRGGSETTLKVTPAKRQPDRVEVQVSPDTPHAEVVQALEELYKRMPDGDVRLFAVRPGGVLTYAHGGKFPGNLEVTIEKRGDKPATIRVKRIREGEDQTWEVTEDKIGELPEDVRPHVQQLLGGQALASPRHLQLRIEEARARAVDQANKAQAQMRQAHEQLDRTLKEYRVRVQPAAPGAVPGAAFPVPAPPTAFQPLSSARVTVAGDARIMSKLDEILRRLDKPQSDALQRLEKEVQRLRKDLDNLRQEKK
jgi:membrane-associated protease RseP (regulator of RpoE activity)